MANYCNFEMVINSKEENVRKIIEYLNTSYDYNDKELMSKVNKYFFRLQSITILD